MYGEKEHLFRIVGTLNFRKHKTLKLEFRYVTMNDSDKNNNLKSEVHAATLTPFNPSAEQGRSDLDAGQANNSAKRRYGDISEKDHNILADAVQSTSQCNVTADFPSFVPNTVTPNAPSSPSTGFKEAISSPMPTVIKEDTLTNSSRKANEDEANRYHVRDWLASSTTAKALDPLLEKVSLPKNKRVGTERPPPTKNAKHESGISEGLGQKRGRDVTTANDVVNVKGEDEQDFVDVGMALESSSSPVASNSAKERLERIPHGSLDCPDSLRSQQFPGILSGWWDASAKENASYAEKKAHLSSIKTPICYADRGLQMLLWDVGFEYNVYAHQFEAIRSVAGLARTFPFAVKDPERKKLEKDMLLMNETGGYSRLEALLAATREASCWHEEGEINGDRGICPETSNPRKPFEYILSTRGMLLADEMGLGMLSSLWSILRVSVFKIYNSPLSSFVV